LREKRSEVADIKGVLFGSVRARSFAVAELWKVAVFCLAVDSIHVLVHVMEKHHG
jgi:hypothetical protein